MKKIVLFYLLLLFSVATWAQTQTLYMGDDQIFTSASDPNYGNVKMIQDARIIELLKNDISINKEIGSIAGWRIQIYFGSGTSANSNANDLKEEFEEEYPEHKAYLDYKAPFFKVRVGDFRTYAEAIQFKKQIENKYDNCWIVEEMINFPNL